MNGRQKGKRIENEFKNLLEEYGFLVNPTPAGTMWNRHTDHWGRFDLEAIPKKWSEYTLFIQIATRWKNGDELKHIESFPQSRYRKILMVRRKDNNPFEIKEYLMGSWVDFDLRLFLDHYGQRKVESPKEVKIERV